jgi:hypothetical protein
VIHNLLNIILIFILFTTILQGGNFIQSAKVENHNKTTFFITTIVSGLLISAINDNLNLVRTYVLYCAQHVSGALPGI